jgi:hypothetical protein
MDNCHRHNEETDGPEPWTQQWCVCELQGLVEQKLSVKTAFLKRDAQIIIRMGSIVAEASRRFSKRECREIRAAIPMSSATWRKFKNIGDGSPRLVPYGEQLPHRWTTVHRLVTLTPAEFETVVSHDAFGRDLKNKDIDAIVGRRTRTARDSDVRIVLEVDVTDRTPDRIRDTVTMIRALGLPVTVTQRADKVRAGGEPKLIAFHSERIHARDAQH